MAGSGYLGASWRIGDQEASDFATGFYRSVGSGDGRLVSDVVRELRQEGWKDPFKPSYLAYILYASADLKIAP